jgi:acyl-homoserine-lactone acylase
MTLRVIPILLAILITTPACAPLTGLLPAAADPLERVARSVTIVRDEWGVPTIYGPTDAAVVFGLAYAQAEDNYWQIEEDYIHALGRASHYYGDRYLANDLVKAAFEVERLSREEYEREPPERRALWDAFAAGLNYYLRTTPGARSRLISPWEPWMLLARFRPVDAATVVGGVRLGEVAGAGTGTGTGTGTGAGAGAGAGAAGAWAVAGGRTAGGHALLLQHGHADFFGGGQHYEMQVHSDAGWHVRGFALLGSPVPRAGHNAQLAWAHTASGADHAAVYAVIFDHPTDPLLYRYDDGWRRATEWEHVLRVNTADGVVERRYTFRRTHHGPIVAERDGRALAVRIGRMEEGGALQQWYEMGRATGLDAFRAALNRRALPGTGTMYADAAGNIYYVHGSAVPRRAPGLDWSQPVDGSSSATEWQGWHELSELPELLNPRSGWLQSMGGTPFLASGAGDTPDPARYPDYMVPASEDGRARSSRRLLEAETSWSFAAWQQAAFDTYIAEAEGDALRLLIHEWEEVGGTHAERAMRVDEAVDALRSWDRVATAESEATTLFVLWQERLRSGAFTGPHAQFRALEDVVLELRQHFGSALVPWGEVNRLQRVHSSGREPFSAEAPSLPVAGAPAWAGVIFAFDAVPGPAGRRYGVSGHGWVSAVELAPGAVRSRSVVPFGQSADPASRHWFDQAPLYAGGELKPAWFTREDVQANARRVYRPGP